MILICLCFSFVACKNTTNSETVNNPSVIPDDESTGPVIPTISGFPGTNAGTVNPHAGGYIFWSAYLYDKDIAKGTNLDIKIERFDEDGNEVDASSNSVFEIPANQTTSLNMAPSVKTVKVIYLSLISGTNIIDDYYVINNPYSNTPCSFIILKK